MKKSTNTPSTSTRIAHALAALTIGMGLSACGKQSFKAATSQSSTDSPGSYSIPAKIDLLVGVDNTGSALNQNIKAPLQGFMNNLQNQNWDFRVAGVPLSGYQQISQIAVSKYDANWGSSYTPPYPGAPAIGVLSTLFKTPQNFNFAPPQTTDGNEPGLRTISDTLSRAFTKSYFLRDDAALVVVVISTGEDTSDGAPAYGTPPPTISSSILNGIRYAKGNQYANAVKLYSFVNTALTSNGGSGYTTSCLGTGISWSGNRYMNAAQATGGKSYNICKSSIASLFSQLNDELMSNRESYISEYVFIEKEPNISTVVMKKVKRDGSQVVIPQSNGSSDGWIYLGYQQNKPTISYPIPMGHRNGYVFQLIGSAQLSGPEKANITFIPKGIQDSQ